MLNSKYIFFTVSLIFLFSCKSENLNDPSQEFPYYFDMSDGRSLEYYHKRIEDNDTLIIEDTKLNYRNGKSLGGHDSKMLVFTIGSQPVDYVIGLKLFSSVRINSNGLYYYDYDYNINENSLLTFPNLSNRWVLKSSFTKDNWVEYNSEVVDGIYKDGSTFSGRISYIGEKIDEYLIEYNGSMKKAIRTVFREEHYILKETFGKEVIQEKKKTYDLTILEGIGIYKIHNTTINIQDSVENKYEEVFTLK